MLSHYLALAYRNQRRTPLATSVSLLTLAIGLICFLTAYAFAVFFDRAEQGFANADRTYVLTLSFTFFGGSFTRDESTGTPPHAAEVLATDFPDIEAIARATALNQQSRTSASTGERALRLSAFAVDPAFLEIFELPFVAGDARAALDEPRSVVLTKDAASRLFGGENPIARSLLIGNLVDATVTGVIDAVPEPSHMGRSPSAPLAFDLLVSMDVDEALRASAFGPLPANVTSPRNWVDESVTTYLLLPADGRLRAETLAASLEAFTTRHVPAETLESSNLRLGLIPVRDLLKKSVDAELFSADIGVSISTVLMALGALVLVVACVNYANLATARASQRVREVGLRKALGAQPGQITRQHLLEAALSSAAALLIALVIVRSAMPLLEALSGANLGAAFLTGAEVSVFLVAVFLVVTLGAGAYPAFVLSRVGAAASIRPSQGRMGPKRLSALLVGAQFAVASWLLIAVTITSLQNARLERIGLGSADSRLVLIENPSRTTRIEAETLRAELLRLPQVEAVTEMGGLPWQRLVAVTTLSDSLDAAPRPVLTREVGYDFFSVMQIDLLAGREFSADRGDGAPPVEPLRDGAPAHPRSVVVDRAFVEEFGLGSPAEAVGRLVYYPPDMLGPQTAVRIVGVVDIRRFSFRGAGTVSTVYVLGGSPGVTVVRLAGDDVAGALEAIDTMWRRLAPNVAISRRFLDDVFDQAYETFLRVNQVFGFLALMAFCIAVAGLFGMAAFVAARRRPEIGVRKTFGASTRQMVVMLIKGFSKPVVIAALVSWPVAYIAARAYLGAFIDPMVLTPAPFVGSLAATLLIAWIAIGGQTLRAARASPARVLRQE